MPLSPFLTMELSVRQTSYKIKMQNEQLKESYSLQILDIITSEKDFYNA